MVGLGEGLRVGDAGVGEGVGVREGLDVADGVGLPEADPEPVAVGLAVAVGDRLAVGVGDGVGVARISAHSHSCPEVPPISLNSVSQRSRIFFRSGGPGVGSAVAGKTK